MSIKSSSKLEPGTVFSSISTLLSWMSEGYWVYSIGANKAYHPSMIWSWHLRTVMNRIESGDLARCYLKGSHSTGYKTDPSYLEPGDFE